MLLMFPSTYFCEQGFSAIVSIKTKFRARLSVASGLQVALSKTNHRIDALVATKQAQPSHYSYNSYMHPFSGLCILYIVFYVKIFIINICSHNSLKKIFSYEGGTRNIPKLV